jgi:hypothetical protein
MPRGRPRKADANERHPLYSTWLCMRKRCRDPKHENYPAYGGRGIRVCERWDDFRKFAADMGPKPSPRHTIERVDNDGNYEPLNCVWATPAQQNLNRRKPVKNSDWRTAKLKGPR